MVTEAHWKNWTKDDFVPYLDVISESFGPTRLMYGSDWPVCLVAASYEQVFALVKDYFSTFSQHEQDLIFGENAIRFYNL
jgi:L-fuconolactonase